MKKIKLYSYTILLIISACIVSPWIFKEIWESSKPAEPHAIETFTDEVSDSENEQTTTLPSDNTDSALTTAAVITTTATTTEPAPSFVKSDASYFDDALFIGDSRTVGLFEYGTFKNADFFCTTGMSVYKLGTATVSIDGIGKTSLDNLFSQKSYSKIYIMLGINEIGYDFDNTITKYGEWLDYIEEKQPDVLIFIQSNLHVTKSRSESDGYVNNQMIDRFNKSISKFANDKNRFYIDINEFFDDGEGNLPEDYTSDSTHVYAKHYAEWCDWLCTKTIVLDFESDDENTTKTEESTESLTKEETESEDTSDKEESESEGASAEEESTESENEYI